MLAMHLRQLTLLILCRFNTQSGARTPSLTQETIIKNMKVTKNLFFFSFSLETRFPLYFKKRDNTKLAQVEGNLWGKPRPSASSLPTTANTECKGMQHCLPRGWQQYELVGNLLHLEWQGLFVTGHEGRSALAEDTETFHSRSREPWPK